MSQNPRTTIRIESIPIEAMGLQELREDPQGNLPMGEVRTWEELTMEIRTEEEVVEMAASEEDRGEEDLEGLEDQGDRLAQEDHPMTLMIGVRITKHIGTPQMDG
jgi:hypothetical protein